MALEDFGMILIFQGIVFASFVASIILSKLVSPRNLSPIKTTSFECGEDPSGLGREQFVFEYYPYLIMFLVFDVGSMFLFAWAATFTTLGLSLQIYVLAFLLVVLPPVAYAVRVAGQSNRWSRE